MTHSNLVADELHNVGFATKIKRTGAVKVTLSNRKVYKPEVQECLELLFEGISFTLIQSFNGVLVVVED